MKKIFVVLFCFLAINIAAQDKDSNQVDGNNHKQGYWLDYGKGHIGYEKKQVYGEGVYKDDLKIGLWKFYYPNRKLKEVGSFNNNRKSKEWKKYDAIGNLISLINYKIRFPNCNYELYYSNGQLKEKGEWVNKNNVNQLWRYNENGCLQEWNYFRKDTITETKQYNDNDCDCLLYEVELDEEKKVATQKKYLNCELIDTSIIEFDSKQIINSKITTSNKIKDGYHKVYNANHQIEFDGDFSNGSFVNGKKYTYDSNGVVKDFFSCEDGQCFRIAIEQ
jgi:antitoxin component YwqK of YwqJK toxin-antitoxin module